MNLFGMLFLVVGVSLVYEEKQRQKGVETWEAKHNITIPKWVPGVLIAIGVVLTFISNFISNLS